jgi:hypothetical protein
MQAAMWPTNVQRLTNTTVSSRYRAMYYSSLAHPLHMSKLLSWLVPAHLYGLDTKNIGMGSHYEGPVERGWPPPTCGHAMTMKACFVDVQWVTGPHYAQ